LDVERFDTVIAPFEPGFSMTPAPATCQGAVIFSSAKLRAQPLCPALPEKKQPDDACNHNHRGGDDYGYFFGTQCWYVHDLPPVLCITSRSTSRNRRRPIGSGATFALLAQVFSRL
jgi:hypothetical protein